MRNKLLKIIILFFLISSCAGIGGKRSDKSDEFLIEKKNPLVMPPKINELPKPKESAEAEVNDNDFKESLSTKKINTTNSNIETSATLEESIIKKIEQ